MIFSGVFALFVAAGVSFVTSQAGSELSSLLLQNVEALADSESPIYGSCSGEGQCKLKCNGSGCTKTWYNSSYVDTGKASYTSGSCTCGSSSFDEL